ncbi:hypothetical protein ADUPG1_002273, partial [Aduncisulcus paluster]
PKPTTSAVKDQVYTPMELKPRCVFCGRANHWCWMCKDQAGKGRGLTPRLQVTADEWRRYGSILFQHRNYTALQEFEKFQKMCVAADEFRLRASVGQSTTPQQPQSSSQPHASQSSVFRPYQPRDMSHVECYHCHKFGHYKNHCPDATEEERAKYEAENEERRRQRWSKGKKFYSDQALSQPVVKAINVTDIFANNAMIEEKDEAEIEKEMWGDPDEDFIDTCPIPMCKSPPMNECRAEELYKRMMIWGTDEDEAMKPNLWTA